VRDAAARPAPVDGALLALGTFSRLPVPPPTRVSSAVAGWGMALAPVVGLGLGLLAAGSLAVARWWLGPGTAASLTAAALAVALLAAATGGLHLDGLADVADGLASRKPRDAALALMRRPEVGALGAATLTLVLLTQVAALAAATERGAGPVAVLVATVTGRLAATLGCVRGVPAARPEGLGAAVAGSVALGAAAAVAVGVLLLALGVGAASGVPAAAPAVLAGCATGWVVVARCVRRLGGITGDVLGASCEVAVAAALVVLAGSPGS
jgi:adenosylcobinamide-GDP ribazoletransferase